VIALHALVPKHEASHASSDGSEVLPKLEPGDLPLTATVMHGAGASHDCANTLKDQVPFSVASFQTALNSPSQRSSFAANA
jgi:hypothetical protein